MQHCCMQKVALCICWPLALRDCLESFTTCFCLLLDESHLELVRYILKVINFNKKDCDKLRKELGVHVQQKKYSYPVTNSSNLKECLRRWLSLPTSNLFQIPRDQPPTLDELADALKSIGYSEAAAYIIKTCKLIIMFNDQCY